MCQLAPAETRRDVQYARKVQSSRMRTQRCRSRRRRQQSVAHLWWPCAITVPPLAASVNRRNRLCVRVRCPFDLTVVQVVHGTNALIGSTAPAAPALPKRVKLVGRARVVKWECRSLSASNKVYPSVSSDRSGTRALCQLSSRVGGDTRRAGGWLHHPGAAHDCSARAPRTFGHWLRIFKCPL